MLPIIDKLKKSIKLQRKINNDTIMSIIALKNFNDKFNIIDMMREPHIKRSNNSIKVGHNNEKVK